MPFRRTESPAAPDRSASTRSATRQERRHAKGDQRGPQRDPARIASRGFVIPAADINQQRPEHRQEGDDGENGPGGHHWTPAPNMNQVINPATPISIAKA